MSRACIAVVDATRARLFKFERTTDASGLHETFEETVDLVNPARRRRSSELFSSSGTASGHSGGLSYGFDDHRDAHVDHMDAEFARMVSGEIDRVLHETAGQRLIVCASPRMLGILRATEPSQHGIDVDEIPRDLVKLAPAALREQLASYGVLPA